MTYTVKQKLKCAWIFASDINAEGGPQITVLSCTPYGHDVLRRFSIVFSFSLNDCVKLVVPGKVQSLMVNKAQHNCTLLVLYGIQAQFVTNKLLIALIVFEGMLILSFNILRVYFQFSYTTLSCQATASFSKWFSLQFIVVSISNESKFEPGSWSMICIASCINIATLFSLNLR